MAAIRGRDLARRGINDLEIFESGKPFDELKTEYGLSEIISLCANENPLGTSPKAVEAMKKAVGDVYLYPDSKCLKLRQKVAADFGIHENMVVFGNGADNIIFMIAQAFVNEGDEVMIADPTFSVYETVTRVMGGKVVKVPLQDLTHDLPAMAKRITSKTKLVFVCNPNNPTGTMITDDQAAEFMSIVPDHCVVIFDEAYAEFVTDAHYPKTIRYIMEEKNVLIIRTLSKIYGMAGTRVGYAVGPEHLIQIMWKAAEPFPVNRLAQEGALAALDDQEFLKQVLEVNEQGKHFLYAEFSNLGMTYVPSSTNFIFVDLGMDSRFAAQKLLEKGILISSGYNWDLPNFARITIGTRNKNEKLIKALTEIKQS